MIQFPLISIITPTLNSAATLERTIRSVVEQDYPNIEYLIVDGGSTDETLAIARSFSRVASVVSEKDDGIADAFNKGIGRATGELIGIINSDDYYQPGIIAQAARWFARSSGNTVLHGKLRYYNDRIDRILQPWPASWIDLDLPFNHSTYFIPRTVYDQVGLYDTSYRLAMDFDWTLRAMKRGVAFDYAPHVMAHFQIGGKASSNTRACHREVLRSQLTQGLNPLICRTTFAGKMFINSAKKWLGAPTLDRPDPKRTGCLINQSSKPMVLTILIPVFNAQATLQRTLDSLERIAYHHRPGVEILLINDGSTDDSPALIGRFCASARFPHLRRIDQANRGLSAVRNVGINAAQAPWVMLLDSDDELAIDPVHFVLRNFDATSLCFANQLRRHGVNLVRLKPKPITLNTHADIFTANSPFFPSGFCFRREMLRVPFDESYRILEDWPCWLLNPELFTDLRVFPHVTGTIIHIHDRNMSAQYQLRGELRRRIAGDLLARLSNRLTRKQRNNLLIQQRIGQLQLGRSVPGETFCKLPCDPMLYVKLWIYALFKTRLSALEPYGPKKPQARS